MSVRGRYIGNVSSSSSSVVITTVSAGGRSRGTDVDDVRHYTHYVTMQSVDCIRAIQSVFCSTAGFDILPLCPQPPK